MNCHYTDHLDPFLVIGPFPVELRLRAPKLVIYHDFYRKKEIKWMRDYSTPLLTNVRNSSTPIFTKERSSDGVTKAVQTWFTDIIYQFDEMHGLKSTANAYLQYDKHTPHAPYSYLVNNLSMLDVSHRIELATQLNLTKYISSLMYQTTYYGLAGMVNVHSDAYGYEKGRRALTKDVKHLAYSGDVIATFMGWLKAQCWRIHCISINQISSATKERLCRILAQPFILSSQGYVYRARGLSRPQRIKMDTK